MVCVSLGVNKHIDEAKASAMLIHEAGHFNKGNPTHNFLSGLGDEIMTSDLSKYELQLLKEAMAALVSFKGEPCHFVDRCYDRKTMYFEVDGLWVWQTKCGDNVAFFSGIALLKSQEFINLAKELYEIANAHGCFNEVGDKKGARTPK
jgi:hypothetical protein